MFLKAQAKLAPSDIFIAVPERSDFSLILTLSDPDWDFVFSSSRLHHRTVDQFRISELFTDQS